MKNLWERILNGESEPSVEIREEIARLTSDGKKLEEALPGFSQDLERAQKALLAESPGALEAVKKAEMALSESKSKISAIASILQDLNAALKRALVDERTRRQSEIVASVAAIDEQASKKRDELVTAYSRACALYVELTGREPHNLDYRFFMDYDLTKPLRDRLEEIPPGGPSLFRQREALESESARLRKPVI